MRRRYTTLRSLAALAGLGILATAIAAPALAAPATGKPLQVAAGPGGFGPFEVSSGQTVPVTIIVSNIGKNTINDIHLTIGADGDPTTAANGDANPPVLLPLGVTVAAAGCTPAGGDRLITCDIGTLRSKQSRTFNAVFSIGQGVGDIEINTKATAIGAEGGNDSGSNQDSYSIEGQINTLPFSCESVTVYKPGNDKTAPTCGLADERNENGQAVVVTLPTGLAKATVKENQNVACPPGNLTCVGDEVQADIDGESHNTVVTWHFEIDLDGGTVNFNKMVVYHFHSPDSAVDIIPLKRNTCRTATSTNCGTAVVVDGVLIVDVQTPGNGKTRILN